MKSSGLRQKVQNSLILCLRDVPAVRALDFELDTLDSQSDFSANVTTDREAYRLIVEIETSGQPRYARHAVARLLMKSGQSTAGVYPIFAAPFISEAAAGICRDAGIGYMDLSGNCRLAFDGIYIERQGRPNLFVSNRSLRSLYQARSSRVLRVLLGNPNRGWTLLDLSAEAGVSLGQVFNVKTALLEREWAVFNKDGLTLIQPERVLRDWAENYTFRKKMAFDFYSPDGPLEVESKLAARFSGEGLRYALTSLSASARLAPAARHTRMVAYVDAEIDRAAAILQLKSVDSGPNVTLILPYDEGVFYGMKEIQGTLTVSPIQAYLDLIETKGVGEDAAEVLLRQVIRKAWKPDAGDDGGSTKRDPGARSGPGESIATDLL
jgi:hypothetical protein